MSLTKLERSTPEEQGLASAGLSAVIAELNKLNQLNSIMILRHGKVVCEGWWHPYRAEEPHALFSLSKSFTSTAIGMCVAEGRLSIDDKVIRYFRDKMPLELTSRLEAMTVRNLLTMSSGHGACPAAAAMSQNIQDWQKYFFENPLTTDPGSAFVYNSMATYMLSALVTRLTGEKLVDYLYPRLFAPLGIVRPRWDECPMGINTGGWGLHLCTEDIAKFGQLYLQRGLWNGRRLIPESWIAQATVKQIPNTGAYDWSMGYGFQFWCCQPERVYRGDGAYGQYCIVMPTQDMVVAITSAAGNMQSILDVLWQHLLPLVQYGPALPPAPAEAAKLYAECRNLCVPMLQGMPCLDCAEIPFDIDIADNALGISHAVLTFTKNYCEFTLTFPEGPCTLQYGRHDWRFNGNNLRPADDGPRCGAMMRWLEPGKLHLCSWGVNGPFCWMLTLTWGKNRAITIKAEKNFHFFVSKPWPELHSR